MVCFVFFVTLLNICCILSAIPDFVKKGLKKFGFDSFRPGQEEAVMRILCGEIMKIMYCL